MYPFNKFFYWINTLQKDLIRDFTGYIREMNAEFSMITLITILGASFIYGVIHSAGPGHGKSLIASYVMLGKAKHRQIMKMSFYISALHSLMSVILTLIMYYLFDLMVSRNFDKPYNIMLKVSGSMILLTGIYIIYDTFFKKEKEHKKEAKFFKKETSIVFSSGIVPCPGVMSLMFFSMVMKKLYVGVLASVFMSIGMGLTIYISGYSAYFFRSRKFIHGEKIIMTLNIISIIFIIGLGLFLLV